jgi:hypothetical protein
MRFLASHPPCICVGSPVLPNRVLPTAVNLTGWVTRLQDENLSRPFSLKDDAIPFLDTRFNHCRRFNHCYGENVIFLSVLRRLLLSLSCTSNYI